MSSLVIFSFGVDILEGQSQSRALCSSKGRCRNIVLIAKDENLCEFQICYIVQVKDTARQYRVYFSKTDDSTDYLVDHSIIMYLINPEGEFVTFYGKNFTAEELAESILGHVNSWAKSWEVDSVIEALQNKCKTACESLVQTCHVRQLHLFFHSVGRARNRNSICLELFRKNLFSCTETLQIAVCSITQHLF